MLVGDHTADDFVLRLVGFGRFLELEQAFEEPELHYVAARMSEPSPARLFRRLFNRARRLLVWDLERASDGRRLGYATVYRGVRANPNVYVYLFDEAADPTAVHSVVGRLTHCLFEDRDVEGVDCIWPLPVAGSLIAFLSDRGFDPNPNTDIDPELEICYTLERETYEAYQRAIATQ